MKTEGLERILNSRMIWNNNQIYNEVAQMKKMLSDKPLVLYGAGGIGNSVVKYLKHYQVEVECLCDKNKSGAHQETGLPIISPDELLKTYANANIIICSDNYEEEIEKELLAKGIEKKQIFNRRVLNIHEMTHQDFKKYLPGYAQAYDLFEDEKSKQILLERIECYLMSEKISASRAELQYFDPEIITLSDEEIVADGGMYVGDTAESFMKCVDYKYRHYYGFEPDRKNYQIAKIALSNLNNVSLINKGLWNCETELSFNGSLTSSSKLDDKNGEDSVLVTSLDTFFEGKEPPTLIKMDIEGSELEALKGSEYLIRTYKPKLAICVYHKPEDMYVLPEIIKSYREDYKLYLRHYTDGIYETVMYAV